MQQSWYIIISFQRQNILFYFFLAFRVSARGLMLFWCVCHCDRHFSLAVFTIVSLFWHLDCVREKFFGYVCLGFSMLLVFGYPFLFLEPGIFCSNFIEQIFFAFSSFFFFFLNLSLVFFHPNCTGANPEQVKGQILDRAVFTLAASFLCVLEAPAGHTQLCSLWGRQVVPCSRSPQFVQHAVANALARGCLMSALAAETGRNSKHSTEIYTGRSISRLENVLELNTLLVVMQI